VGDEHRTYFRLKSTMAGLRKFLHDTPVINIFLCCDGKVLGLCEVPISEQLSDDGVGQITEIVYTFLTPKGEKLDPVEDGDAGPPTLGVAISLVRESDALRTPPPSTTGRQHHLPSSSLHGINAWNDSAFETMQQPPVASNSRSASPTRRQQYKRSPSPPPQQQPQKSTRDDWNEFFDKVRNKHFLYWIFKSPSPFSSKKDIAGQGRV